MEALPLEFGRFIDDADSVPDAEHLFRLLSVFSRAAKFPWVAYHPILSCDTGSDPELSWQREFVNYPDGWRERYFQAGYDAIDPIIKKSRKHVAPFRWRDPCSDSGVSQVERRFFDDAAAFGLMTGVSVPLHGPGAKLAIVSFTRPYDKIIASRTVNYFHTAALFFHIKAEIFNRSNLTNQIPDLSRREKECILWVARGKSSWDIGRILGVSKNTVDFHVKNVMRKLDSSSRTAAAIKAMSFGIIDL
ncbi:LuxR family transcriptional regulator [Mesorhizobium sp. M0159]|uniref:LuxR family transcriptional regulator n=1 Tax=Mesorhizobium sp. M0159 TaxID=2956900 RepID=UPI003339CAFE